MQQNLPAKPRGGLLATKVIAVVAVSLLIFSVGVGVGRGDISFGPDGVFRKSVSKDLPANLDYSSVEQLYDILRRDYAGELDATKLLEGLKKGLASASGDQYTEYLNAEQAKEFDQDLNGTFSGIGAELGKEDHAIVIVAPIAGYAAERAGIQPRDLIAEIDGQNAYDLTISEAVNKIRGPSGTKVKLKLLRANTEEIDVEITRETITIPSVESKIENGIGYLKISRFAEDTSQLATKAAGDFKQAGVKGIVVDVRNDPGGLLDASVDVAGLWLPKGKTVLQEKRDGVVIRTYNSKGPATLQGIPTVVLINQGSASASEILAGALKDNGAVTMIGEKTYGKGSVQQLQRLPDGGVLKVTIARWYTPGGKNIDKEGLEPDQKVERTVDDIKNSRDPQKDAAFNHLNK